jgi:hypothetical protein
MTAEDWPTRRFPLAEPADVSRLFPLVVGRWCLVRLQMVRIVVIVDWSVDVGGSSDLDRSVWSIRRIGRSVAVHGAATRARQPATG